MVMDMARLARSLKTFIEHEDGFGVQCSVRQSLWASDLQAAFEGDSGRVGLVSESRRQDTELQIVLFAAVLWRAIFHARPAQLVYGDSHEGSWIHALNAMMDYAGPVAKAMVPHVAQSGLVTQSGTPVIVVNFSSMVSSGVRRGVNWDEADTYIVRLDDHPEEAMTEICKKAPAKGVIVAASMFSSKG